MVLLATVFLLLTCATAKPVRAQNGVGDDLFAFPPRTPGRLIRAAILANQLDRPLLARQYLTTFLENQPGKTTLRTLRKEIGITAFLKLSATERLQPESTSVLKLINEANPYPKLSPSAIEILVKSLGQSSDATTSASLQLLSAGADAAVPLLNADRETPSGEIADKLLSRYARRFQAGLLSALSSSEDRLQVRILNYLAKTADQDISAQILPLQYAEDPTVAAAAAETLAKLKASAWVGLSKTSAASVLSEESVAALKAASQHQAKAIRVATATREDDESAEEEANGARHLEAALSLATAAVALDASIQAQAAKYAAEAAANAWPAQWQNPSLELAVDGQVTPETAVLTAGITIALEADSTAGLLQMLNQLNVTSRIFQAAPLVKRKCLTNHDPRVRLLAAAAAWTNGDRSERVLSSIESVIDGSRRAEAVVIDPRVGDGSVAAGVLRGMGYSVDFERSGRNGFSKAAEQLHCELIMVHSNCLQWPLSITLANLRSDYRTSNVPIVIYGPATHQINVASRVDSDAKTWFEREPLTDRLTPESLQLKRVTAPLLSKAERTSMMQFSLQLTDDRQTAGSK